MKNSEVIWTSEDKLFRILEIPDECYTIEELEGDCFNPLANPDIPAEKLKQEQKNFRNWVSRNGVFGYALEKWNSEPDKGWTQVDSCWGFIGNYNKASKIFNHYIVDELKEQAK